MSSINFESTYGVIIIQDMNVVSVDANYARIYGYQSPEELMSQIDSFLDLISEDFHVAAYKNYLETVSGQRDPQVHTFTNVDRNGREFTVFSIDHVTEWQARSDVSRHDYEIRAGNISAPRFQTFDGQSVLGEPARW